jgi:predicted nucleic-acid-binding Zn-ribbon protein
MPDTHVTCPNCGYGHDNIRKSTRMFDCPACGTTLFLEQDAVKPIGNSGEMHDYPMLFGIGDTVEALGASYIIQGHARYDYGRGTWDEFYGEDSTGQGAWFSIDEGDVVIQHAFDSGSGPRRDAPPAVGEKFSYKGKDYTVTEADHARCIAVRGQFPELIRVDDAHDFINAAGASGQLLSGEFWDGGRQWYEGDWLDPFTLEVRRQDGSTRP